MRPLDGIRIVDLTNMLMAPYTTQVLGDMGADVIKVEPPEGDPIRKIGPYRNPGMGPIFLNTNRSKRSVVLNLKTDEGFAAVSELIKGADVLVYNRRPQVMERLGTQERGAGGEIQLTDAIAAEIADSDNVYGFRFDGERFDCGSKAGLLQATVAFGLARGDLKEEFLEFLVDMMEVRRAAQ